MIAIGVVVVAGAIALFVLRRTDDAIEADARARNVIDIEIASLYQRNAQALVVEVPEPDHVIGHVIPVVPRPGHDKPNPDADKVYFGTGIDMALYTLLDPKLRIDRLAGADTIVFVENDITSKYGGGAEARALAGGDVRLIFFEIKTSKVYARKWMVLPQLPKESAEKLGDIAHEQTLELANYLNALPRR